MLLFFVTTLIFLSNQFDMVTIDAQHILMLIESELRRKVWWIEVLHEGSDEDVRGDAVLGKDGR